MTPRRAEPSPFPFQGPLEPEEVVGRDDLVAQLVAQVTARRVTALLGPRRYGKTSVLRRLAAECAEATVVWVDLYEVASMADVAARFDQALAAVADGPFARAARAVAATVAVNLGMLRVELRGQPRDRPDPALSFAAVLDVLVAAADRHETLLVIDEFSFISRVPAAAGALRTALQHRYRQVGIVVAGSQPSMMRTLFTSRAEPFYGQAELLEISPLPLAAVHEVVTAGFERTGRHPGPTAALVWDVGRGHPMRSMQLADAVWAYTDPGATVDAATWAAALEGLRAREAEPLERLFSQMAESDKAVLRAVAHTGSVYGAEAALLGVAGGAAAAARRRLLDRGDVVPDGPTVRVTDPLLADWIRRRFPL
ncbi:MAG TPA: ATP-binding protein [Acidimicrobiales bacterium]|nr:ATP-binding protein [Acidimicrobiales bacterium]